MNFEGFAKDLTVIAGDQDLFSNPVLTDEATARFQAGKAYPAKWNIALHQHLLGRELKNYSIGFQVENMDDEDVLLSDKLGFLLEMHPSPSELVTSVERNRVRTQVEALANERDEGNLLHIMHMYIKPFHRQIPVISVGGEINVAPKPENLRTYVVALDYAVNVMGWIFASVDKLDVRRNRDIKNAVLDVINDTKASG